MKSDYMFFFSTISISIFGFALAQDWNTFYLSDAQSTDRKLTISICPKNLASRAGTIFTTRENTVLSVNQNNATITVVLKLAERTDTECYDNETVSLYKNVQFGYYLNFRALFMELSVNKTHPVFVAELANNNEGTIIPLNLSAVPEFVHKNHTFFPRSDARFATHLYPNLDELEIKLELHKQVFDSVNESVVIDFALISSEAETSSLTYCRTLRGTLPKKAYCLDTRFGALMCPRNCSVFPNAADTFTKDEYWYGSCGSDRNSVICGDIQLQPAHTPTTPSWKLGTASIIGILIGAILVFVVGPLVVLCMMWYRRH
ncbi:uncharacterized protein LOC129584004 [Paramacrobiotus metropolitanus]|uniref:uncharacterized protein LOC129584004 n=1 Tax=Paramacrobiotus metropolitanus TaxID=2943436 RepID=UPI0024464666|nr:uncharacterized protein LOC129584004 [Paramacrobiotus metropolitanus]